MPSKIGHERAILDDALPAAIAISGASTRTIEMAAWP